MERKTIQDDAKNRTNRIWTASGFVANDHAYLVRKGIKTHGLKIYREYLKIGGMQCHGAIIVPLLYRGEVVSLQFINQVGKSDFYLGAK